MLDGRPHPQRDGPQPVDRCGSQRATAAAHSVCRFPPSPALIAGAGIVAAWASLRGSTHGTGLAVTGLIVSVVLFALLSGLATVWTVVVADPAVRDYEELHEVIDHIKSSSSAPDRPTPYSFGGVPVISEVFGSILVGLVVSAVLFLPLVVWQYRRYGRFDGLRMLWTTAGVIYATAIVAFTVLPQFTSSYRAAHSTEPLLDLLRFPRDLIALVRTQGLDAVARDWLLWEFALNMVPFILFGMIARRVFEWPRGAVLAAALGTSVLIELTQLTGNWGLAPCPYRFADTTDLFTNTAGALIGIRLEKATPPLLSTKSHLLAQRYLFRAAAWSLDSGLWCVSLRVSDSAFSPAGGWHGRCAGGVRGSFRSERRAVAGAAGRA